MEKNFKPLIEKFVGYHQDKPNYVFSCGGRFEIIGNHTDHNHGFCIASACDLDITGAVKKTGGHFVRLKSEDFPVDEVDLKELHVFPSEKGTSKALIRGVAYYLKHHGYKIGGFEAYTESSIFKGAGVSSSAAFELFIGHIFNVLYNKSSIPTLVLCKAGQYAENEFFGKKSGLLDQIGCGYGGIVEINFRHIDNPDVRRIEFPFKDLHFVLVNTGGDHSQLGDLYSSIPLDMISVANELKERFLVYCSLDRINTIKDKVTELQYNRAVHFFKENERVHQAIKALEEKNEDAFLDAINGSRISSTELLKNMMVDDHYEGSPLEACDLLLKACNDKAAVKINGGGFAGSVISVVHTSDLENVIKAMSKKYGSENVKEINVRGTGPVTELEL